MKLIAQVKLNPTEEQAEGLRKTLLAANGAAQHISDYAWMAKTFGQYDLHHAQYYVIRKQFGLSAQMAVRVIAKVSDSYKIDKKTKRTFAKLGSVAYDSRILTWKANQVVSLWTISGRAKIPYQAGQRQLDLLQHAQGEDARCRSRYREALAGRRGHQRGVPYDGSGFFVDRRPPRLHEARG